MMRASPDNSTWLQTAASRYEASQSDLDSLCAARDWTGREVFLSNEYYGIATTLKRYAGYPQDRPIKVLVPHGVYFNDHLLADFERDSGLPAALVYPEYRAGLYSRGARMIEVPGTAPFAYAERLLQYDAERTGTLFFPAHSLPGLTAEMDFATMPQVLQSLPHHMQPVTVIMYWQDYLLGRHRPFQEHGFSVVSAGNIYDAEFLTRLAYLLKRHKYVASNAIGSHTFYSICAGCTFRLIDIPFDYSGSEEDFRLKAPTLTSERQAAVDDLARIFSAEVDRPTDEQRALAAYYLGLERMLEPEQMRELLAWVDRVDMFGILFAGGDRGARFGVSDAPRRMLPCGAKRLVTRRVPAALEHAVRGVVAAAIRLLRAVFPFLREVRLRRDAR